MPTPLQFAPFSSSISPSFWQSLTTLKLQVLKLSDEPVPITGSYSKARTVKDRLTGDEVGMGCVLELDERAFEQSSTKAPSADRVSVQGILRNYNTIEDFKNADKTALLDSLGDEIWSRVNSSSSDVEAEALNPFLVLTFADLKKYRYYYWCGFPALLQKPGWETEGEWRSSSGVLSEEQISAVNARQQASSSSFTLAKPSSNGFAFSPISSASTFFADVPAAERTLVFLDPSSHASAPGWPLRNVLTYLNRSHSVSEIRVVAVRDSSSRTAILKLKPSEASTSAPESRPSVVGWGKNDKGKLGPRMANLAPLMDPTKLADQAVDLNLQLMRWRIMPSLDLEKVKNTKVLLLGAGTLGCYVARTLMAWGVRKITLVDSSTVSFSNPVRQPLFDFEDSLNGGKPKAEAAAAALKRVYPGVDATGVSLSIPMPGHPLAPAVLEQTKADVKQLEQLIEEHDVVYLLMDSRESRWLPTVIGASKRKLVMNVALGFDTFLVMRHGVPAPAASAPAAVNEPAQVTPGTPYTGRLGCYYCNDIVAPMDVSSALRGSRSRLSLIPCFSQSLTDRTLDQMCTVTRPGIASIASSTAVELMVSILQHPKGSLAPSDIPLTTAGAAPQTQTSADVDPSTSSPLGIVPHQIRGFLAQFNNLKITGQAYDRCTGCSDTIVSAYENDGFEMLVQAFADAKYLERLTGLDKMEEETEAMMEGLDWSGSENEE
ncbi:E1-like protein-activating [Leucosporidium creatinivorum]|uniref:Ubiquitin-like modifier-activating enzyme ATG7 n=1 Tax=Leucosporidium creatinivorum TaxID=106004 RepID=A0A1Y2ESJ4_9BASI|nr:E1-like protein-activating [Leucosporidium creatinivorum]